ncbi:MAG: AarF/ABC1/UbiB kinase family protein [Nanoarchaeota archaeon]|nr:AarF/ABC1/UbiB kinase family protein [Nanoarchaeota archaeon]
MSLNQTFKDLNRLRQIVDVLFKHEMSFLIEKLKLKPQLHITKRIRLKKEQPESLQHHLMLAMQELSGAFIKLGQLLSLRADLIPKEYAKEFSKLQDQVEPFPYEQVKQIIESEFNKNIHTVFIRFEKKPIAAASVGQVHKAILKDGKKVAVKIQRPDIEKVFKTDIDLLYHLADLVEKHYPELKQYNIKQIVEEFKEYTNKELNYLIEARNIETFHKNFLNHKYIKIPKPYLNYTTKRVLTLEYIDGKKVSETKINKKRVVKIISDCFLKQVLEYGIFHADPHPGNIFILKDKKIALLDFGIVGKIDDNLRNKIEKLFISLVQADKETLALSFIELGIVNKEINIEQLKEDMSSHLSPYYNLPLNQIDVSSAFYDLITLSKKYNMKLPQNFVLLIKAIATTEGFCKELDPNYNFVISSKPYVNKIISKRTSPDYLISTLKNNIINFKDLIQNFPNDFKRLIKSKEKVKVDIDDEDIKRLTVPVNLALNKLSIGIIIAGLIIAASLIISTKLQPLVLNIPILSLILYLIALILALRLLKNKEVK